jgi:hypothetical protein
VASEFWGPHLVVTTQDGLIRRVEDPTAVADGG